MAHRHAFRAPKRGATRKYLALIKKDPCAYCGGPSESVDHVEPVRMNLRLIALTGVGANNWSNIAPSCRRCNREKGDLRLVEFLRRGGLK